jgi:hypothetical protein
MIRAAALSLLFLVSVAVMLPLVDSSAHNDRPTASRRHHNMGHRHSRAWWRRHRARLRRLRAAMKRKKALQAMRGGSLNVAAESHKTAVAPEKFSVVSNEFKSPLSALSLPSGWSRRVGANGEMKFVVNGSNGQSVGTATISLINAQASGETVMIARRKMLGGVPLTELRRTVIDKMIASNGWVVNDITREIEGKPVFIVLAQTAASSDGRTPQLSLAFYFTEIEGRIYSLATISLLEFSDRIAGESAQLMASFLAHSHSTPVETSRR